MPLLGALIGYGTNYAAIWMLFHPIQPIRVPGTSWVIQGIVPRRREAIAESLGRLVEENLVALDDITARLDTPPVRNQINHMVTSEIAQTAERYLPHYLPLRQQIITSLSSVFTDRIDDAIGRNFRKLPDLLRDHVDIAAIVRARIQALDWEEVAGIVQSFMGKELTFVIWTGAILGLLIGLIQALLASVLQ